MVATEPISRSAITDASRPRARAAVQFWTPGPRRAQPPATRSATTTPPTTRTPAHGPLSTPKPHPRASPPPHPQRRARPELGIGVGTHLALIPGLLWRVTLSHMVRRSREAETLLAELDSELSHSSAASGVPLSWTPAERRHLDMIADTIDRRVHLQGRYDNTDPTDTKNLCRLSTEIRLCDALVSRLLAKVTTEVAAPMSQRSRRAQHAALSRHTRERRATA